MLNTTKIRLDFPILKRIINGYPLIYLDNGATSQKPRQVISAITDYYENHNANVHRGAYTLSDESTDLYEKARENVASFIGAASPREIVFVRNSTEAINLVAYSWGRANIEEGDEIVTSEMEHHSDFVPWQLLAKEKKANFKVIPFNEEGILDLDSLKKLITSKTKLLALVHVSNALGTINPVKEIIKIAKSVNPKIITLVDGSQSVQHLQVTVSDLDCDFLAFTGHKMLGPMGSGVLWGKEAILNYMAPFLTGGGMIKEVHSDYTTWADLPEKFEAGTPNVEGAVGLSAAIDYLKALGMGNIRAHEMELTEYALSKLKSLSGLTIYGPKDPELRGGIVTFNINGVHAHDVSQVFDKFGICVRAGHHCTMPLHQKLGIPASVRASFYIYNTKEEIDKMIEAIEEVKKTFKV